MNTDELFLEGCQFLYHQPHGAIPESLPHHHDRPAMLVILLQIHQGEGCPQKQYVRKEVPRNHSRQEGSCVWSN